MEGTEKPHRDKCKGTIDGWNYNSCMLTSLPVSGFEHLKN
jgi:hypothetical protein